MNRNIMMTTNTARRCPYTRAPEAVATRGPNTLDISVLDVAPFEDSALASRHGMREKLRDAVPDLADIPAYEISAVRRSDAASATLAHWHQLSTGTTVRLPTSS